MAETCAYVLFSGRRYGDSPEPDETCDEDALEGSEFCHLHADD